MTYIWSCPYCEGILPEDLSYDARYGKTRIFYVCLACYEAGK
jgi:hypothetical protein